MKVELTEQIKKSIRDAAKQNGIRIGALAVQVYPTMPHDKAKAKLWRQLKDSRYRYIERETLKQIGITLKLTLNF